MQKVLRTIHSGTQWCFAILFAAALFLPVADMLFHVAPALSLTENRNLTPPPDLGAGWSEIESYPAKVDAYLKDNFGFRKCLIQLHTMLMTKILGQSPNRKVLVGKNNWLYFNGEDEAFLSYQPPLSETELDAFVSALEAQKKWFDKQGIRYFVLVAPDKQAIYPEYLPEPQATWIRHDAYDAVLAHFRRESKLDVFIDVKRSLLAKKAKGQKVYYQTDSHWNPLAAFTAYRAIVDTLNRQGLPVPGKTRSDYDWSPHKYYGDLVTLQLGIPGLFTEEDLSPQPRYKPEAVLTTINKGDTFAGVTLDYPLIVSEAPNGFPKTAVMIRDSQFIPILPHVAETFSRVVYVNVWENKTNIDKIIEAEKAEIVIHEVVERALKALRSFAVPSP